MQFTVDDPRWQEYCPPGANGPLIWFVVRGEIMEIRMTTNLMEDHVRAAETLGARFFVRRYKLGIGLGDGWGVFDSKNIDPNNDYTPTLMQDGKKARPIRVFDSPGMDGPVMWAIAKGSM